MHYYRVVKTGEVLGAAHSSPQPCPWVESYAAALGIDGPIESFTSDEDPRASDARVEPQIEHEPTADERQAGLLEALAVEWEEAATNLRTGKPDKAAEALERAAATAKGAAEGLRG